MTTPCSPSSESSEAVLSRSPKPETLPQPGVPARKPESVLDSKIPPYVILTGNPNCGKTTLFNALTGLRAKVGNYAGVTVERKEGKLLGAPGESNARVLDLPGTYSLSPQSLDEQISRDVLMHRLPELPPPSLVVIVVDASNLQRNLYYATQVIELGYPTVVALNMIDVAADNGHEIDAARLADALGVPVLPVVASNQQGLPELKKAIVSVLSRPFSREPRVFYELPAAFKTETDALAGRLQEMFKQNGGRATAEALLLLCNEKALASSVGHYHASIQDSVLTARKRLEGAGIDWRGVAIEERYVAVSAIQRAVTSESAPPGETLS